MFVILIRFLQIQEVMYLNQVISIAKTINLK